jgi:GNAT superfamily N-acetyltransferase
MIPNLKFTEYRSVSTIREQFKRLLQSKCYSPRKALKWWYSYNPISLRVKSVWVVEFKGNPIAMALTRFSLPNFAVYVKPKFRRRGIATKLVQMVGYGGLTLHTHSRVAKKFVSSATKHPDINIEIII